MDGLQNNTLDDLIEEARAAIAAKRLKAEQTYVVDLIGILAPHGQRGLPRQQVLGIAEQARRLSGLPIPAAFEETVQSAFNQHCITSAVFKKRNALQDALFLSRRAGSTAYWSLRRESAIEWLRARNREATPL